MVIQISIALRFVILGNYVLLKRNDLKIAIRLFRERALILG
jgi:hypothetical protein